MSATGGTGAPAGRTRAHSRVRAPPNLEDEISIEDGDVTPKHPLEVDIVIREGNAQGQEGLPDAQVQPREQDRGQRGEAGKGDIHKQNLKNVKEEDSSILFNCAKDVLKGLRSRASGVNAYSRAIRSIQEQLQLIQADIKAKQDPGGQGIQGTVTFVNEERQALGKQISDLRTDILHIDSAL